MSGTNIKIGVVVDDGGSTKKVTNGADLLAKSLDNVTASATRASAAVKSTMAPSGGAKTKEALKGATVSPQEGLEYGRARAAVGTGAAGRDFANQAQGLGGLVRVYATFAANIFAVSAAFEALNKAAQTERLIQSLDKLSVSAGANLKSVAKSLQEASGQALSFGEAVQFTNIGTTAGLAGQQIESLTKIARGAATVLGRDVGDSIRRIIQGTAKQEQEILDELGIFLKANQAYEKYAQAFNIKVDDLTAQQKTQAYANEVERLGQKFVEFAEIPDPFTKFTATGKDALNSLLSSINKAVTPVLELFASSEGAIKSMIGLISTILLRQALPELATALSNLFTFDKAKINAEAAAANKILEDKYIETTTKLHLLKKQRDQIMVPEVTAETLGAAVGASALTRGKAGQQGLSVQRLSTALLKDDELSKAKKLEDVEKSISLVLKEQVRDSKDRETKLDALIQKGLVSKESTVQEIKLGKESEEIAKRIFAQITAQNAALAEQLAIEKSISVVAKEKAALSKTISDAPKPKKSEFKPESELIDASAAASARAAAATQADTAAKAAQNTVLKENIGLRASYTAGLGVAATAEAALTSAMAGGLLPTLKATGVAMKAALAETLALAGGATILNAAAILAGGGIKVLSLGLKGLIATLNIIMIPIMLVITAWELFGDKIKNLLPETLKIALGMDEASKSADKLADKLKDVAEGAGLAGLAQENLNKSGTKLANWSEQAAAADKQAKIIRDQIKASEDLVAQRTIEINQLTIKQRQEEAASKGLVFSERSFGAEQLAASQITTKEQSDALKLLAADWYALDSRRKSANMSNAEYTKQALDLDKRELEIKKEIGKTAEQNASSIGKVVSASQNLEELSDKIAKKSKEVRNVSLGLSNSDVVTWYEKIETLNNAVSSSGTRVEDLKLIHDNLKKAVAGSTKAQAEAAPVIEILNTLMGTEDVNVRAAAWEQLKETVLKTTGSIAKSLEDSAKPRKIEEYSAEARKALIKFKADVTDTGLALRRLDIEISNTQALSARKDALLGYSSEASIAAEKELQEKKNSLQYTNSLAKAEEEYQRIILKRTATPEEKAAAKTAKSTQVAEAGLTKDAANLAAKIAAENKATESAVTKSNRGFEEQVRLNSENVAKKQAELSIESTKLDILKQQGMLTETQLTKRSQALDAIKTEAQFTQEKTVAELERQRAIAELKIRAAAIPGGMTSPEALANEKLIESIYQNKVNLATINNALAKESAVITNDNATSQAKWNDLLKESNSLVDSLGAAFEGAAESSKKIASALGNVASTMVQVAINADNRAKAEKQAQETVDKAWESMDYDKVISAEKEQADLKKRNAKQELADDIKTVNSAKKLFKEKTAAYKILNGIEKVMHVTKLAMEAKELAVKLSNLTVGTTAKAGAETADTGLTIAGTLGRLPAYAAEIYGKTIGQLGPIAGPAVATALVAAMFGMFGKGGGQSSAGFAMNSEQRQETQGTGTTYNALGQKVETGGGVFGDSSAKVDSIKQSLEIIRDNSVEGLAYDNKMLNALQNLSDALTGAATAIYAIPGLRQGGTGFGSQTGTTKDNSFLADIPLIGGLLGGIFGGGVSATSTIESAGIQLKGSFQKLIDDTTGSVKQYKDILTQFHEDGGWFGSDDDWTERRRETADIGSLAASAIRDVFIETKNLFTEIGASAGVTAANVQDVFNTLGTDIDIDLKGLTGDEITAELNAVIGTKLDAAAQILFSSFDKYKKFGESYLTTVVRVVDTNTKIQQVLTNMGIDQTVAGIYDITEGMADLAGGLDKFVSQYESFSGNFLTEAERLVPVQKAVIKEMARLGFASVDTRAEFKALVQGLDVTTVAGRENYQALMDVAEGFDTILDYTEAQAEALRDSAKGFRDFIVQIKEFKNSLLLGASSILTPEEKYTEARIQFESVYAQALAGDKTAMSKVTSSAQTFLDASKTYFASSDAYTSDFNTVLSKLDNATISAGASASVAELQLNALSTHTDLLSSINTNIALIAGVPQAASGGRVSGLTLVGEMGPELVDFTTPGRVYTADQTAGMFTPAAGNTGQQQLIQEVRNLRQEVAKLREQQSTETGHLINATYDAQSKNAEQVTEGVTEAAAKQAWAGQLRQSAAII